MSRKDPRVDAYIAKSADFAKPILKHLRRIVHAASPKLDETIKWGFPHFTYKGVVCGMGAFKQHCTFGFWKRKLVFAGDPKRVKRTDGMGQFGRITRISDLPNASRLSGYVRKAVQLNEAGIKTPARPRPKTRPELIVPDDFAAALKKNKKAQATFQNFSYSHRKEYVQWITEAKRDETRQQRLATAVQWLARGKPRHWKYINC